MRKHVIVIDGIARVGEHYPMRARHKGTGAVREVRDLALAGLVPGNIKIVPEADAVGLWGDWEPIYPELAAIVGKFHPDKRAKVTSSRIMQPAEFPAATVLLKDAWEDGGAAITVNMVKARTIHMDRIRVERDKELKRLDEVIATSEDTGPRDAANRAKRQELRDIPQTFDLSGARDATELLALWPPELPRPLTVVAEAK